MTNIKTEFLILGGGLSGLFAALFLNEAGHECIILEKADEVGGLSRTYSLDGHSYDLGGHRIFFGNQKNIKLLHKLIPDLLLLKRKSKIYYNNAFIDYPISLTSFNDFSKKDLFKIFLEFILRNRFLKIKNFEDWIKKNYGNAIYEIVFEHYSKKVWGLDCKDLSPDWAQNRIGDYSLFNLFLNIKSKERVKEFYYPAKGIGLLAQNAYQRITPKTKVFKNVSIQNVEMKESAIQHVQFEASNETHTINCKNVISTIPLKELLKISPLSTDLELQKILEKITYRSLLQVNILLNKNHASDWHWCYFPDKDLIFSRCYEPKYWDEQMSEKSNDTLLCIEIFCNYQDEIWEMNENDLVLKVLLQLIKIGLLNGENECRHFSVKKEKYAYPLLYLGYEKHLNEVFDKLSFINNLHFSGRNGTHSYFDIEECIENVQELTNKLITSKRLN